MKTISISILIIFTCFFSLSEKFQPSIISAQNTNDSISQICQEYNALNTLIRDCLITPSEALSQLKILLPKLKKEYYDRGGKDYTAIDYVFPVKTYNKNFIGGNNGSGYIPKLYDFLEGNKHKSHPAHDIFIYDSNQDCLDDRTKQCVYILSVSSGIVIACDTTWNKQSTLRGGNYIWVLEPATNSLFYYAHNNKVSVEIGKIIAPGDTIATIGRTGLNAFVKRSPTHLHFMQLQFDTTFYPKPVNCYKLLINSKLN